jgi:hypothetical protein
LTKKLKLPQNKRLLFAASLSVASLGDIPVFVKVGSVNYGEGVQCCPTLVGKLKAKEKPQKG